MASAADPVTYLPSQGSTPPRLVVGTLDLNTGVNLPSEELIGALPEGPDAVNRRAYLSNVCVLGAARRQGVARTLITQAQSIAHGAGVSHLYVHVVHDNAAAVQLYTGSGFAIVSRETEAQAHGLGRPRRLLLGKAV